MLLATEPIIQLSQKNAISKDIKLQMSQVQLVLVGDLMQRAF